MNEYEMILEQAMQAFIVNHHAGTLSSIEDFLESYPVATHEEILELIEEYLVMEAEFATTDIDPSVLEAVDSSRHHVLDALSLPRVSLRELRKQAGLLPAKLAEHINLPTAVVAHLEGGRITLASLKRHQWDLLVDRLSGVLHRPSNEIAVALRTSAPINNAGVRFSAEDDTVLTEEPFDFIEALEQSPKLTAAMRAEWITDAVK
ncbi:MAG TPA: helix-turn-helix transcriptional regulator [Blastocatellia bacterium]|nr:helix-turn-helix transcriptional regulator [Blastocatellia bacterium]